MLCNKISNLEEQLDQFIGTTQYWRLPYHPKGFSYTDGIKFLAEHAACYWLLDKIAFFQIDKRIKARWDDLEEFQVWRLTVNEDKTATLICSADTDPVLADYLTYTDFPLRDIKLYVEHGVLLLPSEH